MQLLSARLSLIAGLTGAALALAAVLGVRFGLINLGLGLGLMWPAAAICAFGFLAGMTWLFRALKINDSQDWRPATIGLATALLVLVPSLNDEIRRLASPPLIDITTDTGTPPQFIALLPLRAGAQNGPEYDGARKLFFDGKETTAVAVQKKMYAELRPRAGLFPPPKPGSPPAAPPKTIMFWRALEKAKAMGWHIVDFDEKSGRIEATDSSFFFGMTDDIAISVRPAGRIGARVDIRSKSRMGDNDGGANAARIKAYVQSFSG